MHHSAVRAATIRTTAPALRARAQFAVEAHKARAFGKPFMAAVLESLARTIWSVPAVLHKIETWPGDLASAGVIFRVNAGLHALARSGRFPMLQDIYRVAETDTVPDPVQLDFAVTQALLAGEDVLLDWLRGPTQTNEIARVAGLAAVLAELSAQQSLPCRILELGASAGLNLNLEHYHLKLGQLRLGPAASAVHIAPRWSGPSPLPGEVVIAGASGVDLCPLDVTRPEEAERLAAYIWPGEKARAERLQTAIALAHQFPPRVAEGSAAAWLEQELEAPQPAGERRVVFHAMALQYMPEAERARIGQLLNTAGALASPERPLAHVAIEWNALRSDVEVRVACWDGSPAGGVAKLAALTHPYAEWFEWRGLFDQPCRLMRDPGRARKGPTLGHSRSS